MDWKRCIIWQKATGENLQCPANSQRRAAGASYVSLSLNISTILSSKPFVLRRFQPSLNILSLSLSVDIGKDSREFNLSEPFPSADIGPVKFQSAVITSW